MRHVIVTGFVVFVGSSFTLGEVPVGYEVIDVTSGMIKHSRPRMNNCGEIVFSSGTQGDDWAEVMLYDNGRLVQVTDDDVSDAFPDINDRGVIAWWRHADEWGGGDIAILDVGELTVLGQGHAPSINNLGHVAWSLINAEPCPREFAILFYDGNTVRTIIDDGLSNQSVRLNDHDEMVWTRYYFPCEPGPWTSEILFYSNGVISILPSSLSTPQRPDLNNLGQAGWGAFHALELWDGQETFLLTDGHEPSLNNVGDVAFEYKTDEIPWEVWLYRDGQFAKISNDPTFHNGNPRINDAGEIVWLWHPNMTYVPTGIRFMRRVRNGDVDLDEQVDLADFADLPGCLTGPVDTDHLCLCRFYDMDHDRDVDLSDFADFQNRYGSQWDCCTPHDTPGCSDPRIQACVCERCGACCWPWPWHWDSYCVGLVEAYGCGSCP